MKASGPRRLGSGVAAALGAFALLAAPAGDAAAQRGSISVGKVDDGLLVRGAELAPQGPGWAFLPEQRGRGRRFAVAQLVRGLRSVARRVSRRDRNATLRLGDLSRRGGGPVSHHASHQSGRDVDIAFFTTAARASALEDFVPFDRNLRSTSHEGRLRFAVAENWSLVEAILTEPTFEVQFIFVAPHLRQVLLDHAREAGRPARLRSRASRVLRADRAPSSHNDHFHVRIYCPADDLPRCVDTGPVWPWISSR